MSGEERRAVQLLESGQRLSAVARQVGAAVSSVFRWGSVRAWSRSLAVGPRPRFSWRRPGRVSGSPAAWKGLGPEVIGADPN
jgi:hypothetical protein